MKILLISTNFSPELTGIGKYSGEMAQWLADNGNQVRVICSAPYYPEWKINKDYSSWRYSKETKGNLTVLRCPIWVPEKVTGIKRIIHLASFALSSFPIVLKQIFWKPDVVICVEPPIFNSVGALFTSKLSGAKSILHIQDFEINAAFDLGIIKSRWLKNYIYKFESFLLKRFTRVSTISESMKKLLSKKGVPAERQLLFPNWVDTDFITPRDTSTYRAKLSIAENKIVAFYSGNMGEKQGLEIIIKAAKALTDITFVMCGTGSALTRLREKAADLNNIIWLPLQPYENLCDFLNLADIHLLPQQAGAADLVMPSKLTGMLSSGKAIIATADEDTEIHSVIQSRGLAVRPEDTSAFIKAIQYLADHSDERINCGSNARKYAETHLNYKAIMEKFYMQLLDLKSNNIKEIEKSVL
ncbi:MAG TPA: colanic acid biosynthesis glycosyltransferase WcaI [Pseudoalteromonas sp.]|nr:colanic acid biosynthesis glycosyltransferase WcaI [Pseudoalteromonas sp.]